MDCRLDLRIPIYRYSIEGPGRRKARETLLRAAESAPWPASSIPVARLRDRRGGNEFTAQTVVIPLACVSGGISGITIVALYRHGVSVDCQEQAGGFTGRPRADTLQVSPLLSREFPGCTVIDPFTTPSSPQAIAAYEKRKP